MLRFIYTALDVISTVLVVLSPIAVIHWLLKAFNVPDMDMVLNPLSALFDPLNSMLEAMLPALTFGMVKHFFTLRWAGNDISTAQGFLAMAFTLSYFCFSYAATLVKGVDKQINDTIAMNKYKRQAQMKQMDVKQELKVIASDSRVWVFVNFPFSENPQAGELLGTYLKYGGQLVQSFPTDVLLEFKDLAQCLQYCTEAPRSVLAYYATLRPMDPQPPFKIAIHAVQERHDANETVETCRQIAYYAAANRVVFSDTFRKLLEARGANNQVRFFSNGTYTFSGSNKTMELYSLELR